MLGAAWTLDVVNVTKGWSLSTWAGKADTVLDAAHPLLLQAPFKASWSWKDYPSGLEPRQASFELRALTAAALQTGAPVDPGDLVDVHLFRNPTGVVKWTWHRVVGYLDEPEASQDDRGLVVKLTAIDPLARLAETPVDDPVPWPAENLGARLSRIAQAANINIVSMAAFATVATMGPVTVNNKGALPLLQECLAGALYNGQQLVLRGTVGDREWTLMDQLTFTAYYIGDDPAWTLDEFGFSHGLDKAAYVVDVVGRTSTMLAPYTLTAAHDLGAPGAAGGVGLWVTTRTPLPDLSTVTGGAALDAADVLRDTTSWVKSRATAINTLKLVGVDAAGEEKSVVASWSDLAKRDGPSVRVVQTQRLIDAGAGAVALALLPDRATATPGWTADTFTLTTRALTASQLTAAARELYPNSPDGGTTQAMQLPVAIVGIDPTAALTGSNLSGILQGVSLQIDKTGVLQLVGVLRMEQLQPVGGVKTSLVTWAQLKTEPVDNAPSLQWSTFTWKSAAATPHQTSDRIWNAAQAHAMFAHVQLSWMDLRLIGVD